MTELRVLLGMPDFSVSEAPDHPLVLKYPPDPPKHQDLIFGMAPLTTGLVSISPSARKYSDLMPAERLQRVGNRR
jgi:hypothetical protein